MTSDNRNKLYSDRLLKLTRRCPQCGALMTATGEMYYDQTMSEWFIEYWCANDEEIFPIFTPETDQLARDIAKSATANE